MRDVSPVECARTVVIGAGGYAGAELVGLLLSHPSASIEGLFVSGRNAETGSAQSFGDLFPRYRGLVNATVGPIDLRAIERLCPRVVFLATPHEASHDVAGELVEQGAIVIDLSGAFRLRDASLYRVHYGFEHQHPRLLRDAAYGLPEINRHAIEQANLIAAAGCYPTSAIVPLRPLVSAGAIEPGWRVIIDATSGVSGAGRAPALRSMYCEVSLQPYGVLSHRHAPEIEAHAGTPVVFTPHLGAFERGILSTMHVRVPAGWSAARVAEVFETAYADEPFVRLLPRGAWPSVGAVERTNFCDIGWALDEPARHLIVVSAIDNLVKGAAGQAVQCMNARLGLPEITGLLPHGAASVAAGTEAP